MGGQQTGTRKHVSFFLACCLVSAFGMAGCADFPGIYRRPGGPETIQGVSERGQERISKARVLYDHGEYRAALREAEAVLKTQFQGASDEALFLTGLIYAHPNNPDRDWQESLKRFRRLKEAFPVSGTNEGAELYALLIAQIVEQEKTIGDLEKKRTELLKTVEAEKGKGKERQQETERLRVELETLKDQLEKLKEIDLGMEEKKIRGK
jgi:hypothetical protein